MAGQKTITQRIAFEGGKEMEVQLKQLGDAGTTAFNRIKAAADNASGFGAKMAAAVETVRVRMVGLADAASNVEKNFSNLQERSGTVATRLLTAGAAVVALGIGFTALIAEVAKATEEIENSAGAAGLTAQKYQELQAGFQIAGIGSDQFGTLMNKMNKTLDVARKSALDFNKQQTEITRQFSLGKINSQQYMDQLTELRRTNETQITVFSRLGLSAETFGNDTEAALNGIVDAMSKMERGTERSALELEVFGRAGTRIDAIVEKGSAGLAELVKDAQRVAPALTVTQLAVGNTLDDAFDRVKLAAKNTEQQFFLTFGPVMTTLVNGVTEAIVRNRGEILQFAQTLVGTLRPVVADIVSLLNGDTVNPNGFVGKVQAAVTAFVNDLKIAIGIIVGAWQSFVAVLDVIAKAINKVFGTNLTGQALALVAVVGILTGAFSALAAVFTTLISLVGLLDAALVLAFGPEAALLIGLALLGAAIGALLVQIPSVKDAFQALVDGFNGTVNNFVTLFKLIGAAWQLLWQEAGNVVRSALGGVLDLVQNVIDKIGSAISAAKSFFNSGGQSSTTPGFATGGKVNGPGSSRSDSILARLSNGEFVQQAPAVSYYGERFMHALNHMQIPRSLADGVAGFANGGLVRSLAALAPVPGFANGGLVSAGDLAPAMAGGGRPFVLQIGDEVFTGLHAEDKTADKLSRYATRRSVHSAGRRPSWDT